MRRRASRGSYWTVQYDTGNVGNFAIFPALVMDIVNNPQKYPAHLEGKIVEIRLDK